MRNTLETRLGIFFALALLAAAVVLEMLGGMEFFKGGMTLRARFNSIQELKLGDPVRMAGVEIGRVERIDFADTKILVTMKITDRRATIRTDSKATIKFTGLLGQNYLAVDFGSGRGSPILPDAELQTVEQADFGALMARLDSVAGDVKKITENLGSANFTEPLDLITAVLREERPNISNFLTNLSTLSTRLVAGQGTAGKLINEDTLYQSALSTVTNLNETTADIKAAVNQGKALIADISAGQGTLGKLATDEKLYAETATAMTNLKEILQKINQGQGSVGKLVNDESLFKNAKLTLQKLDKATEGLEDQGPLSVIGVMANSLF